MQTDIVVGLVEDDVAQAEIFSAMLEAGGLSTRKFSSVQDFRRRSGSNSIDVLVLDWNLPGVSGIDLLRSLRGEMKSSMPVILLTANDNEQDIVYGLKCGADDYVIKPPRQAELVARVRAAHRRSGNGSPHAAADTSPFQLDMREREMRLHGELVKVTEREFELLAYLFHRAGRIVSRGMLLSEVWKLGPNTNSRSVDTYISRVRKSLGLLGKHGWVLEGIYQHGYRLSRKST
jgi:two-component system, OmpR family, response regulator RegX3